MKSSVVTIGLWWILLIISFVFPYWCISTEFNAGFNVSDWNEFHRQQYVEFVYFLVILIYGPITLSEYINNHFDQE